MSNINIMIVDDTEMDRYLLKRLLLKRTSFDGNVLEAQNGAEALEFFNGDQENFERQSDQHPPGLVFLDINMPIMGGFKFLENFEILRGERPELKSVVLTMFSSSDREEEKQRACAFDCVGGYVTKGTLRGEYLQSLIDTFCNK